MEIKEMNFDELQTRKSELAEELKTADMERLEGINAELDAIEERKKELKAEAEERAKVVEEVINAPAPTPIVEERTNKMDLMEIRKSSRYINAYADYVKGGCKDDTEVRKILSENGTPGTDDTEVPAPEYLEERIRTAWENDGILSRVMRTYIRGNVKIGYEVSSTDAVIHTEGGEAVTEENLVLGMVELVPVMVKKWISVSDEALALTGRAFLDYIYDEIQYRLFKKLASEIISKISASSLTATIPASAPLEAVVNAFVGLSDEATDIVVIMRKSTFATIKNASTQANYSVDPFNGFDVVFSEAVAENTLIVGDLKGVTVNFPEGDEPTFVFDDRTLMTEDLVRILGRLYVAYDVTAPGRFAKVTLTSGTTTTTN